MRWSWKLATIAGIPVYVHATFALLIGWVALRHWADGRNPAAVLEGVGFILALFACVVLHEFGHALTARRYGIKTRDITLLPIGGLARLERMPDQPMQELWVALAGPAVNVVIAAALFLWVSATPGLQPVADMGVTEGPFLERLMLVNVFLAGFNLLPAFPMDGGRVLRALLATRMEYTRATQTAATVGQGMAVFFGFIGLFGNPFLLFIALFVWIGAQAEASMVQMKSALGGIPVRRAMITEFATVAPAEPLSHVVELLLRGSQKDFPVVQDGRLVGVLTLTDVSRALAEHGPSALVGSVMRNDYETVDGNEMLEGVLARLQACQCHTAPVLVEGRLAGLVTMDNIGEFLAIQAALDKRPASRPHGAALSPVARR